MSNGWLIAAAADAAIGAELAAGFGLEVLLAGDADQREAVLPALVAAPNLGLLLTAESTQDEAFVALLRMLAGRRTGAQLIVSSPQARAAFPFIPNIWPVLTLDEAQRRARLAAERRGDVLAPQPPAQPPPPPPAPPPAEQVEENLAQSEPAPSPETPIDDDVTEGAAELETLDALGGGEDHDLRGAQIEEAKRVTEEEAAPEVEGRADAEPEAETPPDDSASTGSAVDRHLEDLRREHAQHDQLSNDQPVPDTPPSAAAPPPRDAYEEHLDELNRELDEAPAPAPAPARKMSAPEGPRRIGASEGPPPGAAPNPLDGLQQSHASDAAYESARERFNAEAAAVPADATAFAPKKLRRGEAELVRIAIHQPKDLKAVIKAARQADPRTNPAPQSMGIGEITIGATIGVSLDVKGGACDGAMQRLKWRGSPLDFSFSVEADADAKQVVILARVFVNDAQIGVLAFTRGVVGPRPKPLSDGERVRLKRHKRVFLSYSSKDRETVATIATAYEAAGVAHFWDRTSLKSGEEWHPRLRREIDRCDLFHLCWSKSAAESQWVEKEASHALGLRRRKKKPDITVQMLDGPPWAKHPDSLDSINFDDFVRAAIVGYARGDGS